MADISSLYPRPVQQDDPLTAVGKIGNMANSLAPLVVGQAMQQAIDPATGQVDQNRLLGLLKQSPIGASQAVPQMNALQQLRSAGYAADQAGLETFQKRMAITYHLFSGLASRKNPTMNDVHDVAAAALDPAIEAHKYGITLPVIMNAIKQFRGLTPEQIRKKALEIQTMAATTSEILEQHNPRYEVVDQGPQKTIVPVGTRAVPAVGTAIPNMLPPGTPVATPQGQRYLGAKPPIPGGGVVGPDGRPIAVQSAPLPPIDASQPSGPAASLRPGYQEAASATGAASGQTANRLTEANDTSMGRTAILGNLEDLIGKFEPGKAADWSLVAKNFASRNLPVPKSWKEEGGILDLKSIAGQEEFNKLAVQLAQQQFAAIGGTGTDAKFSSAFETSPNETLTKLGNRNIIKLLKGNEDAIRAKNKAWVKWKTANGPDTYPEFSLDFNEHFDPRVFQFKYLDPKDRQEYINAMTPAERDKLLHDMTYARKQGWVRYDEPKK